mgnify:CR=1 FL=1
MTDTVSSVKKIAARHRVNLNDFPVEKLQEYLEVEGFPKARTLNKSFKEVLEKLEMAPDYYERLKMMELKAQAHWRSRPRKSLYKDNKAKVNIQ